MLDPQIDECTISRDLADDSRYDTMGRLNTLTDLTAQSAIISGTTYGPSDELLTMSGLVTETRTYNSMLQLLSLVASASAGPSVNLSYAYSSTQNNGKITSQTDNISGEQVVYTYDALNRLASATATNNSWGQSYSYDGFGNLTGQTVTAGSAPSYSVTPDPSTNHLGGEDANGNTPYSNDANGTNYVMAYDVENRYTGSLTSTGSFAYGYAPGNKRVYRGVANGSTLATDEVTYWSATGQKLATYQMVLNGSQYIAVQTGTYYWFGRKLIRNATGYVAADRLGSIGKFYPYGLEKPSATTNGTEKFTGYLRDAETGLDYAKNRYHDPGTGRFMTPDPYIASVGATDPGSWNRYAYTRGDPVSRFDPSGLQDCTPSPDGTYNCGGITGTGDPGDGGGGGSGGSGASGGGTTCDGAAIKQGLCDPPPPQIPCGPNNPGGVSLTQAQQGLLGATSFGALTVAQQQVFLVITSDASQLGLNLTGYALSLVNTTIAGAGSRQTELGFTGSTAGLDALESSFGSNFSPTTEPPFFHGTYGSGGNWRQTVPQWSMQITATTSGNIQIDIDPNNPDSFTRFLNHFGDVAKNAITGTDTNYLTVANALQQRYRGLSIFNCP